MQKQSLFHRNQSRLWKTKESIGVSVCVFWLRFFFCHPPPIVLELFHKWIPVHMFVPLTGPKSPGKMGMANFRKGDPNFFRPKPFRRGPYFEKVAFSFFTPSFGVWNKWSDDIQRFLLLIFQPFVNMNFQRRPKSLIPPEEVWNYATHSWVAQTYYLCII